MQSLSATLLAEQKKARAKPALQLLVSDKLGPHLRLVWTQLYTDSSDDEPSAMVICADNSIVRVRSHGGVAQYQRITSPTTTSQWTTWTGGMGNCSTMNQMALCTVGSKVWWVYIDSTDMLLYCRESTDYGASWGGPTTVHTCTGYERLESVAAAHRSGTDAIVFYSVYDMNVASSCHAYRRKQSSGSWGSASSWGKSGVLQMRGLTCHKTGDYNMLYGAKVDAYTFFGIGEGPGLADVWSMWAIVYGDGVDVAADTWPDPVLVERTDVGTAWATAWPSLTYVDLYRALFTGYLVGEEYSRVMRMRGIYAPTFLEAEWTDPFPFKAEGGPFGMVIFYRPGGDGYVYASHSNCAYRAKSAGEGTVDLGSRLVKYRVVDRWTGWKGSAVSIDYGEMTAPDVEGEVWLDNHDGALGTLGCGTYAAVKRGSLVTLRRGYVTGEGAEYADWPSLWLEDYEYVVDFRGRSYLVMYVIGAWGLLANMAAQRQYQWVDDEETAGNIAARLFALGGFRLMTKAGEPSDAINTLKPAILIHPGQHLRGAILGVLSKVPDLVYWQGPTPYAKELDPAESSDYSYGGAGEHVIVAGRYGVRTPGLNHIEVFAGVTETAVPIFGDEVDYDEIDLVGHRLQKVYDYAYDSDAECDARAAAQLRKHDATVKRGRLVTLPNVGLQLLDVVTVTDARAGMSSEVYRVRGIEEVYDTTKGAPVFEQRLDLGAR